MNPGCWNDQGMPVERNCLIGGQLGRIVGALT